MYEYAKKRFIPSSVSTGLGTDSYTPANLASRVAPYAIAETKVQNINVRCYENAPREQIVTKQVPYTMELSVPGHSFVCIGNPDQECPASVHRNTDPKDPWRNRQCATWRQGWEQQAAGIIASQGFRNQVTENILNVVGITGWRRWFTKPAEFVQVLDEKESRERVIKIAAVLALAASGGAILWTFLTKKGSLKRNAHYGGGRWKPRRLKGAYYQQKSQWSEGRVAAEYTGKRYNLPDIGTGTPPPAYAPWIIKELYSKMVRSAARNGMEPGVVRWVQETVATWLIGNMVVSRRFGVFTSLGAGRSTEEPDTEELYYSTSFAEKEIVPYAKYDKEEKINHRVATMVARTYYDEL